MKTPPRIHIVLRRSRYLGIFILTATILTCALLWMLPWPWWVTLAANILIAVWCYFAWQKYVLRKSRALTLTTLTLYADGRLLLGMSRDASDERIEKKATLQDGYFVGNNFMTLLWCENVNDKRGSIIIVADTVTEDEWRRLKILLRYARTGVLEEEAL